MKLFKKSNSMIGLDIGKSSIKSVEFEFFKEEVILKNIGIAGLSFETIIDELIINSNEIIEKIRKLLNHYKITSKKTSVSIPGNSVIIKRLELSGETFDDIKRQVDAEAPNHIPYNISDVEITFHVSEKNGESDKREVLLIAVKKEILDDYVDILIESGLKPEIADIDFFALQNIFEFNYREDIRPEDTIALLNVGINIINIVILKDFKSLFYRDSTIANYTQYIRLMESLNTDFLTLESWKISHESNKDVREFIHTTKKNILTEISKGIDLFLNSSDTDYIDKIFLSGGGVMQKGLKNAIIDRFPDSEVDYLNPFKKIVIDDNAFDPEYINYIQPQFSIAAGLAIRGLYD
jgi:type IV pilus assembly protein PilM